MASLLQSQQAQLQASPATTPYSTPTRKQRGSKGKGRGGGGGGYVPHVSFMPGMLEEEAVVPSGQRVALNPSGKAAQKRNQARAEARRIQRERDEEAELEAAGEAEDENRDDNIKATVESTLNNRFKVNDMLGKGGATVETMDALASYFGFKLAGLKAEGASKVRWPPHTGLSAPMRRAAVGLLVEVASDHYIATLPPNQDPSSISGLIPEANDLQEATPCRRESE